MIRSLFGYWTLLHPYNCISVTVITVLLAASSNTPDLAVSLPRIGLVMLLTQFAIGTSNDIIDVNFDQQAKPWKPIPSGRVSSRGASILTVLLLTAAGLIGISFGVAAFFVLILGVACGFIYNLGVKRTIYSWIPHAVAAPTILLWVRVINGTASLHMLWIYGLGLLLGPALNLADQLSGAEESAASGEHSLVHQLGVNKSWRLSAGLFGAVAILLPLIAILASWDLKLALSGSAVVAVLDVGFIILAIRNRRMLLWPIAIMIGGTLGLSVHLMMP